jgi:hypothetical protein
MVQSIAWWPTLVVLMIATGTDLRGRQIPNVAGGLLALALPYGLLGRYRERPTDLLAELPVNGFRPGPAATRMRPSDRTQWPLRWERNDFFLRRVTFRRAVTLVGGETQNE